MLAMLAPSLREAFRAALSARKSGGHAERVHRDAISAQAGAAPRCAPCEDVREPDAKPALLLLHRLAEDIQEEDVA